MTFANADAGREQFFLISEDDLSAEGAAPVPEPGTLLLLAPVCSASEAQHGGGNAEAQLAPKRNSSGAWDPTLDLR